MAGVGYFNLNFLSSRVVRGQCKRLMTITRRVLPVTLLLRMVIPASPKLPMLKNKITDITEI